MARQRPTRLPVQHRQSPAPMQYADPAMQAELTEYMLAMVDPAAYVERKQRDSELYLRWKIRQAEIRERDKKFRRFWIGFGALVGVVFLVAVVVAGWLLWTVVGLGALAVPVVLGLGGIAAAGGHRCITIVQHTH